ncbi:MAG: NUDIX hydrolase [Gemmataceae bacterium]
MSPQQQFQFCPTCSIRLNPAGVNPLSCPGCQFTFYFNPTVAAAGFIFNPQGEVILLRRAKDPGRGLFTIPGGFIDAGETAEAALRREVQEEVGLPIENIQFVLSWPNRYSYKNVTYDVCDLIFRATTPAPELAQPLDGAEAIVWRSLGTIDPAELAFPSVVAARNLLRSV